jgi:hypothetical protein
MIKNAPLLEIFLFVCRLARKEEKTKKTEADGLNNYLFMTQPYGKCKKISWRVTGIRRDPWANAHRIQVEEDKPDRERGYYIYPDLYEQPPEKGISHLFFPEEEKWQKQLIK